MKSEKRLFFIDSVRAFAILMMLQGHFIDSLLNPIYRNTNNAFYTIWVYFRGITAPTFFTISGLIFLYLLLKANRNGSDKARLKKGFLRALLIIGIGYLLRIPFLDWFVGSFNSYFLITDVLQIIGLSLVLLIVCYLFCSKNSVLLSVLLFVLGFSVFLTEPLYRKLILEDVPEIFSNYISKEHGSVFTLFPWFGYVAFGGFLSVLFFKFEKHTHFKNSIILSLILIGLLLINYSTTGIMHLARTFESNLLKDVAYYNYLFPRLGNVLILFAIFYALERFLKQSIILKIGQKTLSIYIIHFVLIFGSFFGVGLKRFLSKSLEPFEAIIGALLFIVVVCLISFYYIKTNAFIYKKIRRFTGLFKK